MKVLVVGASGATGRLVVSQLLAEGVETRILVRESAVVAKELSANPLLETVRGGISELRDEELRRLVDGCGTVISCLGHNLTVKGLFGKPRRLVFDAVRRICDAVKADPGRTIRLILMSTTAYTNRSAGEKGSPGERFILSTLKLLLPPHKDNMDAADYLIHTIGSGDESVEWVAVRPDGLVDEDQVSEYELCASPERSPIFDAGTTSRINVGRFMVDLATDEGLWGRWKYKTPVIYNR